MAATATTPPSSKTHVSRNCAVPRFHRPWSSATNAHVHSRASRITFIHIKILPCSLHTSKFVGVRLLVATANWRTVIHCLLYDNTTYTVCWPGVEFPPLHIYLSVIRQRPLHYLIYYSDCWTQTVTPEFINPPHTLSAYSSWSIYIFAYQISETDCYLPLPSIPGAEIP